MSAFRYLYHHNCTAITIARPYPLVGLTSAQAERTHICCCSAWRIAADGGVWIWRDGGWREPRRGEVKSKATDFALAPIGAVEAVTRPTRARIKGP